MAMARTARQRPAFQPGRGRRRFGRPGATSLAWLAPQPRRALRWQQHLAMPDAPGPLAAALDCLAPGVVLLDAAGRLVWANRAGLALLAAADGIALDRQGRVQAATAAAGEALQRVLAAALAGAGAATPLPRPSGRPALAMLAVPLPPEAAPPGLPAAQPAARLMLLLTDPAAGLPDAMLQGRLRSLWGLTAAEAVVAAQTAHGAGLPEVAQGLGIALSTARTHAQRVFAKAGLRGQAELARQVERLNLLVGAPAATASGAPPHSAARPPAIA